MTRKPAAKTYWAVFDEDGVLPRYIHYTKREAMQDARENIIYSHWDIRRVKITEVRGG